MFTCRKVSAALKRLAAVAKIIRKNIMNLSSLAVLGVIPHSRSNIKGIVEMKNKTIPLITNSPENKGIVLI